MENNLLNQRKFNVLYWGQEIAYVTYPHEEGIIDHIDDYSLNYTEYLNLKSLSSITDEGLRDIANIFFNYNPYAYSGYNDYLEDLLNEGKSILKSIGNGSMPCDLNRYSNFLDFLRSEGYALPWMGLSVEKMIKYGWIRLK